MSAQAADFFQALQGQREISITVKGRRTGRQIALPVWFVQEGPTLYLLPVRGAGTQWLRNLLADPSITLSCRGQRLSGTARVFRDPQVAPQVADKFRARYRPDQVARYYNVFDCWVEVPLRTS